VDETAFESAANIRDWNVVSAHPNAPSHARDCLLDTSEPEIMQLQFVARRKGALKDANMSFAAKRAF
jgi:hypothetical protein